MNLVMLLMQWQGQLRRLEVMSKPITAQAALEGFYETRYTGPAQAHFKRGRIAKFVLPNGIEIPVEHESVDKKSVVGAS